MKRSHSLQIVRQIYIPSKAVCIGICILADIGIPVPFGKCEQFLIACLNKMIRIGFTVHKHKAVISSVHIPFCLGVFCCDLGDPHILPVGELHLEYAVLSRIDIRHFQIFFRNFVRCFHYFWFIKSDCYALLGKSGDHERFGQHRCTAACAVHCHRHAYLFIGSYHKSCVLM